MGLSFPEIRGMVGKRFELEGSSSSLKTGLCPLRLGLPEDRAMSPQTGASEDETVHLSLRRGLPEDSSPSSWYSLRLRAVSLKI